MTNSRTRSISYTPRYTQMEAFDLLPRDARDALKQGPQEWDTAFLLRAYRKWEKAHGPDRATRLTVNRINAAHEQEIANGRKTWCDRKPGQPWASVPDSPHNRAKATMQGIGA